MLYCDVTVNGKLIVAGVLCNNLTSIIAEDYLGFIGDLYFNDIQGSSDPDYTGLASRFNLLWVQNEDLATAVKVPLDSEPNQSVTIALGTQNTIINLYTRTATLTND